MLFSCFGHLAASGRGGVIGAASDKTEYYCFWPSSVPLNTSTALGVFSND